MEEEEEDSALSPAWEARAPCLRRHRRPAAPSAAPRCASFDCILRPRPSRLAWQCVADAAALAAAAGTRVRFLSLDVGPQHVALGASTGR